MVPCRQTETKMQKLPASAILLQDCGAIAYEKECIKGPNEGAPFKADLAVLLGETWRLSTVFSDWRSSLPPLFERVAAIP